MLGYFCTVYRTVMISIHTDKLYALNLISGLFVLQHINEVEQSIIMWDEVHVVQGFTQHSLKSPFILQKYLVYATN